MCVRRAHDHSEYSAPEKATHSLFSPRSPNEDHCDWRARARERRVRLWNVREGGQLLPRVALGYTCSLSEHGTMSYQIDFWPEDVVPGRLTWSVTRDKRLRSCLRKYWLHHFASRGGNAPTADAKTRELYVLKHLRNRWMWVGETVHEMIELALTAMRRGDEVPIDALVERGTRRMRAQYAESIQGVYRDQPQTRFGLLEHEYRADIIPARSGATSSAIAWEQCLRTFFALLAHP